MDPCKKTIVIRNMLGSRVCVDVDGKVDMRVGSNGI